MKNQVVYVLYYSKKDDPTFEYTIIYAKETDAKNELYKKLNDKEIESAYMTRQLIH